MVAVYPFLICLFGQAIDIDNGWLIFSQSFARDSNAIPPGDFLKMSVNVPLGMGSLVTPPILVHFRRIGHSRADPLVSEDELISRREGFPDRVYPQEIHTQREHNRQWA
jgi:hypothetical protein